MGERLQPVILAAGAGLRLGGVSKALFEVGGRPLVDRCLDVLDDEPGLDDPLIVTGHHAREVEAHVGHRADIIRNPWYAERNNFHSLRLALERLHRGRVLVIDCDVVVLPRVVRTAIAATPDLGLLVQPESANPNALRVSMRGRRVTGLSRNPGEGGGEFIGISTLSQTARGVYLKHAEAATGAGEMDLDYDQVYSRMCADVDARAIAVAPDAWAQIDAPSDVSQAEELAARTDLVLAGSAG